MTDLLWTPSDLMLEADPIAAAHVASPHPGPGMADTGIVLPDYDDEASEVLAAVALADEDELGDPTESGDADDDSECLDDNEVPTEV